MSIPAGRATRPSIAASTPGPRRWKPPPCRPLPGTSKLPLAERVSITERMAAAGVPVREIAGELCVGIATACRYLKAHLCSDCARPVVGEGEWCLRCATRRSNPKRWSAQELLDAIIAWEQLEGRRRRTWTGGHRSTVSATAGSGSSPVGRRQALHASFGNWTEMMVVAGYPPYNPL